MGEMKLLAVVRFNDGYAFVFDNNIEFEYNKFDNSNIIGEWNGIYHCYAKRYENGFKAFSNREFDIKLKDGNIEHCKGQWWDDYSYLKKNISDLICCTYSSIDSLCECYVFTGAYISEKLYNELISSYSGKIYEYDEYRNEVIKPILAKRKEIFIRELKDFVISIGCRQLKNGDYEYKNGLRLRFTDVNYASLSQNNLFIEDRETTLINALRDKLERYMSYIIIKYLDGREFLYIKLKGYPLNILIKRNFV